MKKIVFLMSSFALIIGIVPFQKVQAQASVTAHATAEVIEALSATETATMNFGRFSPETTGGEISLSPSGVRSATGTVALSGGSYNPAIFYLSGQKEASVNISLPTAPAFLTNTINGKTMAVDNWVSIPASGTGSGILNNGLLTLNVGATLKVGNKNDNPPGTYAGTYSITISYN